MYHADLSGDVKVGKTGCPSDDRHCSGSGNTRIFTKRYDRYSADVVSNDCFAYIAHYPHYRLYWKSSAQVDPGRGLCFYCKMVGSTAYYLEGRCIGNMGR
jgi:hypothetical protein